MARTERRETGHFQIFKNDQKMRILWFGTYSIGVYTCMAYDTRIPNPLHSSETDLLVHVSSLS